MVQNAVNYMPEQSSQATGQLLGSMLERVIAHLRCHSGGEGQVAWQKLAACDHLVCGSGT